MPKPRVPKTIPRCSSVFNPASISLCVWEDIPGWREALEGYARGGLRLLRFWVSTCPSFEVSETLLMRDISERVIRLVKIMLPGMQKTRKATVYWTRCNQRLISFIGQTVVQLGLNVQPHGSQVLNKHILKASGSLYRMSVVSKQEAWAGYKVANLGSFVLQSFGLSRATSGITSCSLSTPPYSIDAHLRPLHLACCVLLLSRRFLGAVWNVYDIHLSYKART